MVVFFCQQTQHFVNQRGGVGLFMDRYYRERLKDSILIVADFGRYPKEIAQLQKDVVAPYEHVVPMWKEDDDDSIADPFASRNILLFFQGRVERKDVSTDFASAIIYGSFNP